ncbi:MAG: DsbA family protein [Bacteriovoracaceae bacterium]|nr:DsbA family protein [Bacteriovoracaceae bacterium]
MKRSPIYFDYVSPYSYFVFHKIKNDKKEKQNSSALEFQYLPILLSSIFTFWGQKAPAEILPKRLFLFRDALRYAKKNEIPFIVPPEHPFNSLLALRMSTESVATSCDVDQYAVIEALWNYIWRQGKDLNHHEKLVEFLSGEKLPGQQLLDASFSGAAKSEIKRNMDLATKQGVFGVPTIIEDEELFWGNQAWEDFLEFKINGNIGFNQKYYQQLVSNIKRES